MLIEVDIFSYYSKGALRNLTKAKSDEAYEILNSDPHGFSYGFSSMSYSELKMELINIELKRFNARSFHGGGIGTIPRSIIRSIISYHFDSDEDYAHFCLVWS